MHIVMAGLVGLMVSVGAEAGPVVEGWVRLASGEPVAGAQVLLFDLNNLRRYVGETAEEDGHFVLSLSALAGRSALPYGFGLGQNYPNPFNPGTVVPYQVATDGYVRLEVFNLLGQRVATLVDGEQAAGSYTVRWDARDASGHGVAAGVYLYRLIAGRAMATRQMVLVDGSAGFDKLSPRTEPVEALPDTGADPVYGLVVFGEGMMAYVDAAFRVGAGPIVVEAHRPGRGKAAQRVRVLGDVDNNGWVDLADALLVMAYSLNASVVMPNGGDIALGDVNGDGATNMADARLILLYSTDPSNPTLPSGLGPPRLVEPIEAGLLTIPPITLTVGSSYRHLIRDTSEPLARPYYSVASNDPTVVVAIAGLTSVADDNANEQWWELVIEGVSTGTAEVRLEGALGDQTIPVTVVERPGAIDSVTPQPPQKERIKLVFYTTEGVLDPIEEKIPWFLFNIWAGVTVLDHVLDFFGVSYEEVEEKSAEITWVEYVHSNTTKYAISRQPLELYKTASGLRREVFVVLQDAKRNVVQDIFLSLAPSPLAWPASLISIIGDIQMYASILDVVLAAQLNSSKVELRGIFAADGSIIQGNSYIPLLMMKSEEHDIGIDLRLNVMQAMDIESVGKKVRSVETIDFGPLIASAETGYQILSNQALVFTAPEGKDLTRTGLQLATGFYDQNKEYRVRGKGPSLAVEWVWASREWSLPDLETRLSLSRFQRGADGRIQVVPRPLELGRNDQFNLWPLVLNRSEQEPAASVNVRYYCSPDPTIMVDDQVLKTVELEGLNALGEMLPSVRLPAPRTEAERTGTEALGTCWVLDLAKPVYYGACVWDEVEGDYNACSSGVPVQLQ